MSELCFDKWKRDQSKLFLSLFHLTTQMHPGRQVDLDVYYSEVVF